ncbi:MAG: response regulator [Opitutaceae bacterium]|nr:response regulator [Opitutaceae bacterium]
MPFLDNLLSGLTRVPPRGGIEAKVEAQLVRIAYRAAVFGGYIHIGVPLVILAVLWEHFDRWMLAGWAVCLIIIGIGRLSMIRSFFAKERTLEELPSWTQRFRLGAFATAALWGFASWLFLEVDHPVMRAFVIFVVTGLNAGASRSLAPIPFCFTPYSLLALSPIIVRYSLNPEEGGWALALLTGVYVAFLSNAAHQQRKELERLYRSLIENDALLNDLREAKQRAEVANKAKSEFLSTISHEIHTPMHGVLGMLQLLEESELTPDQRVQVDVALGSANALHGLLRDILDFSRIESGRLELAHTPFHLPDLVRELGAYLEAAAEQKDRGKLELRTEVAADLPTYVVGDPVRLRQAISNLLGNAVKFTEKGRIDFSTTVVVSKPDLAVVRFSVKDTGPGMNQETQLRAFERFTQGEGGMSRVHGGVGLGLTLAQQVIWRMGGEIKVKSQPGEGSHFWFEIPLARAALGADEPNVAQPSPGDLLEGTVLVVEDDRASRQVIEMMLKRWGLVVRCVSTAEEALALIKTLKPTVVLMDVRLPGMDGMAATREIRQLALRVPVVALTANTSPQDRSDCLEAGMDGFLAKPVQSAELHRCLKRWLAVKR